MAKIDKTFYDTVNFDDISILCLIICNRIKICREFALLLNSSWTPYLAHCALYWYTVPVLVKVFRPVWVSIRFSIHVLVSVLVRLKLQFSLIFCWDCCGVLHFVVWPSYATFSVWVFAIDKIYFIKRPLRNGGATYLRNVTDTVQTVQHSDRQCTQ